MSTTDSVNRTKPPKILIVDDEQIMRQVLRVIVNGMGLQLVAELSSGDSVLASMSKHRPDILLLDINLPGEGGMDILQQVRKEHANTKVVMISGDSTQDKVKEAIEYGAVDFIAKPFNPDIVMKKLKQLLPVPDSPPD